MPQDLSKINNLSVDETLNLNVTPESDELVRIVRVSEIPDDSKLTTSSGGYYGLRKNGKLEPISGNPSSTSGVDVESGIFTLSADGMTATGGILTNPGANPTITIVTTKKLIKWTGKAVKSNSNGVFSLDGESDGVIQTCLDGTSYLADFSNCIHIADRGGEGWTGLISEITDNSYSITFNQLQGNSSNGLDIICKWIGLTE